MSMAWADAGNVQLIFSVGSNSTAFVHQRYSGGKLPVVTAVSKDQRAAIFDYFKNPSMEPGKSVKPAPGQMGPGGASSSPINLGGGLDAP